MKRGGAYARSLTRSASASRGISFASLALALEPRFMYDAAGAATAATVADQAHAAQSASATDRYGEPAHANSDHSGDAARGDITDANSRTETSHAEPLPTSGPAPVTEIVFVDGRLPDIQSFTPRAGAEIVVLDPARDGITQVSETLAGYRNLSAIHFVGHGESGSFGVGSTAVDGATLAARAGEIAGWGASLGTDGDIMIWGCDVGSMPSGEALVGSLSALTGADVAASADATGAAARGGDWILEVESGEIDAATPFEAASLDSWDHLLDPPTISGASGTVRVAEPSDLNAAGADRASLAAWQFNSNVSGSVTVTAIVGDTSIGAVLNSGGLGTAITGGWSFTGTLTQANAWLDSLNFAAADVERGNSAGSTSISLTIQDADGGTANHSIAVEVTPSNDRAILDDRSTAVIEGGTLTLGTGVLAPVDPEVTAGTQVSSQIVYRLTDDPQFGYLTLNDQRIGVGSIFTQQDVIGGKLAYHHTATGADQNSPDSFTISLNDGATPQASSDTATITLDITPVNQAPTVSGSGAVYEGQPANATLGGVPQSVVGNLINASGGGDSGDTVLNVQLTDLPDHGTLYFTGTATVGGVTQSFTNHAITASDINTGFVFVYANRAGLTYANDGVDGSNGRPPNDSFGVKVIDGGGGTGTAAEATGTIDLTIRPANDDPVWVETSTRTATVPALTGNTSTDYKVILTPTMLNATDVDSAPENITFIVTSQTGLNQGRLVYKDVNGAESFLPEGGTFTLADVQAGRVQYWQLDGADPATGLTDSFIFQVVDNALAPHWNDDGAQFERLGGVYTGPTSSDTLRNFTFTINLIETPNGTNGTLPTRQTTTASASSTFAGTNPTGTSFGSLVEGGTVVLTNGTAGQPGLNYTVEGVDPSQVVYTVLGFDGAGPTWNGELQKFVNGAWVNLSVYDTFSQADLNAGLVRFQHDGGEDFESSVRLQASAGVLVSDGSGGLTADQWDADFTFYIKPVNDAPVATGSSENIIDEGETVAITSGMLNFGDADDAQSESYLEGTPTLPGGGDNYAVNHDASEPLTFTVTNAADHGKLQYYNGSDWLDLPAGMEIDASWITNDPASTRLRYVHDGGEDRSDAFEVQATDRWGATSTIATVGFFITNVNDAPQIAQDPTQPDPTGNLPSGTSANQPLEITWEGSFSQITSAMLRAVDPDSTAQQVQYRITTAPAHGRIAYSTDGLNFTTIGVGSAFSQADLDAGRIYYLSNGDDPTSSGYPSTPDDTFVFTLADGAAEQTAREFWIYLKPTNDAPVVTAPSGPVNVTDNLTSVPGFSVADPDLETTTAQEQDFVQVVVRLLNSNNSAFGAVDYADVQLDVTAGGTTIDADHDGNGDFLVLRGTAADVNAALTTLKVSFGNDRDQVYKVEVIADDRLRDAGGNLVDRDGSIAGVQPGGNGGGTLNEPETPMTGTPLTVPSTEYNWYADAAPTSGAIAGNIAAATVIIRASSINDPATLTSGSNSASTYEDQATPIGSQISFTIADPESAAFGTPVTVTLTVPSGMLNVAASAGALTVSGRDTGTLVLTGTAQDIQNLLNSSLTYRGAQNVNHDLNGVTAGDVTLAVSFSDSGSNLGTGQAANNPPDLSLALDITPVNDVPTVSAGSGSVLVSGSTVVPGFSVGDIDLGGDGQAGLAAGETDFVQVTVRITSTSDVPLSGLQHQDVNITSMSAPGEGSTFEVDNTYDGTGSALVIRGTRDQVNTYLAGLQVEFTGSLANSDNHYRVEVVADDRVRDVLSGALTGGADGGLNDNGGNGAAAVPTTAIDPYAAVPGGLALNVASNSRDLFSSGANDPAHIDLSGPLVTPEGSTTVQLGGIAITDSDALSDTVTATVTLPSGFTFASAGGSAGVSGIGTGTLTLSGSVADINSTVNSIRIQLPDVAGAPTAGDWNGTFNVTIEVNDGGHNGARPGSLAGDTNDATANPGDFAFADGASAALLTTRSFTFTVTPVNDAPQVVGDGTETLPAAQEDSAPAGQTVGSLFGGQFGDPLDPIAGGSSSNSFAGVAIVGLTTNALQGTWQYFDGSTWVAIGTRSLDDALILSADTLVRFNPAADFHGTPNAMTVRLVEDGGTVPTSGTVVDLSGGGATGGTTRYSSGSVVLSTSVTNTNDRPTLGNGTLSSVPEDTTGPSGATVSALFGVSYGDVTDNQSGITGGGNAATSFGGIAIIGNTASAGQGIWQYSLDQGATWDDVSTAVSDAAALLLPTTARLRFLPAADFNGIPDGLTVRGADSTVNFAASADISATVNDQTSTWSFVRTLSTMVTPLNDAPVLNGTASNPTVVENSETGTGNSIPGTALVNSGTVTLSDIDLTTTPGLSVFGSGQITVRLGASFRTGDVLFVDGALPVGVNVSGGTNGTLTITLDGDTTIAEVQQIIAQISYRNTSDNPTNYGADTTRSYTITLEDGNNQQAGGNAGGATSLAAAPISGTITIQITNDPPVAVDDVNTIAEGTASVGGNVIAGAAGGAGQDTDPDTQVLTVTDVSRGGTSLGVGSRFATTHGWLTLHADGTYTYELDNSDAAVNALKTGQTLTDAVDYTISDGASGTDTATLTITITGTTDGSPTIMPVDGNGGATGEAEVHEHGLIGAADTSETTTGTVNITAPDGLASITVGGTTVTLAQLNSLSGSPVVIDTGEGTLTLTSFTPGAVVGGVPTSGTLNYSYVLKVAQNQPAATEGLDQIPLMVTDAGGDTAIGTLTVLIIDDAPTAQNDAAAIVEDSAAVSGNVVTGAGPQDVTDSFGADGPPASGNVVTDVSFNGTARTVGTAFTTAYGSLTLNADGSYTYQLDNSNPLVNELKAGDTLSETTSYTIIDSDGETSTATLKITIQGNTDGGPSIVPVDANGGATGEAEVYERGLTSSSDSSETTTGTVNITSPDGLASITVGGTTVTLAQLNNLSGSPVVIDTGEGTLTLTGFTAGSSVGGVPTSGMLSYSYALQAPQNQPSATESLDPIALMVTDNGGGSANGTLAVRIIDDAPTAHNDAATIVEDTATVSGNVVTGAGPQDVADVFGADGPPAGGDVVTGVSFGGTARTAGTAFTTAYGSLTLNADGSYSYTLDNGNPAVNQLKTGDSLSETVSYTIVDSDGETSSATLTITIEGNTDGSPSIVPVDGNGGAAGEAEVQEHGLTSPSDISETRTGTVNITSPDGLASITVGGRTVALAELQTLGSTPISIDTGEGILTLTGFVPGLAAGAVPTSGTLSYSYMLKAPQSQPSATEGLDPIALTVTDAGGDSSTGTLTVRIIDDVPVAEPDAAMIAENTSAVTGNVVSGGGAGDVADDLGADGGTVTGLSFNGDSKPIGTPASATYGTLTLNADGSYSYVLDNANPAVDGLRPGETVTEVFTYTITDSDGDTSTAELTITITGSNDAPVVVDTNHTVSGVEDGAIVLTPDDFASTDVDTGDALEDVRIINLPARGTLYLDGKAVIAGDAMSVADIAAGKLTYRPAPDGNGAGYTSFRYQLGDGTDYSATATMRIDIEPRNDTPTVTGPSSVSTMPDTPVAFDGGSGSNHAPAVSIDDLIDLSATGAADAFTISLSVANGVISIADPTGAITGEGSGTTLTISGTRDAINAALATLTYRADRNYAGSDQLTIALDDHLNGGSGAGARPGTATHVVDITVIQPPPGDPNIMNPPDQFDERGEQEYWGGASQWDIRGLDEQSYGDMGHLEGRPIYRYTVTWQPVTQQMSFQQYGLEGGTLFFEARLGRDLPLPSWITFDAHTQSVTAIPDDTVKPGVYTVRVVARDTDGNEAESVLTIHVLRDVKKSFDFGTGKHPHPEKATKPAKPDNVTDEIKPGSSPQPEQRDAPTGDDHDGDKSTENHEIQVPDQMGAGLPHVSLATFDIEPEGGKNSISLSNLLLALGPAGQMIQAARFIESLAADASGDR
ncbi:VCBS domain-containing protein [Mesorhizobium sp. BR1-1-13]|uniref:cadherin-like domain-containing protein n=1 Tax=Mesorhizobium sp. BR1-1-13 TaxID=2876656 RepID=UPI001CD166D2|nr:cadherin-like domain-containing protein [Mesorhizobium sp. BR1-1-13]MBZ9944661.1 VCBS domain-containing protein [Mesorhizobium sp. BR1-1-13]